MSTLVYILNGPNLNLLGKREPDIYGSDSLSDIEEVCRRIASDLNLDVDFRQTNQEGELVDWIQESDLKAKGLIVNAAAYTHTSVALLDALTAISIPIIEVHLSNVYQREEFRHKSFVSPAAQGVICGFGVDGYRLALQALNRIIDG